MRTTARFRRNNVASRQCLGSSPSTATPRPSPLQLKWWRPLCGNSSLYYQRPTSLDPLCRDAPRSMSEEVAGTDTIACHRPSISTHTTPRIPPRRAMHAQPCHTCCLALTPLAQANHAYLVPRTLRAADRPSLPLRAAPSSTSKGAAICCPCGRKAVGAGDPDIQRQRRWRG